MFKLEWQKNKMYKYVVYGLICTIVISFMITMVGVISKEEHELVFTDYSILEFATYTFVSVFAIIMSGILLSKLVIDEYRNDTIKILFTTKTSRKKIMFTKLVIVYGFTFLNVVISSLFTLIIVCLLNPNIGIVSQEIHLSQVISSVPSIIINGFMIAGVSLIPLYFGMLKKSVATTITTAVIISLLLNSTIPSSSGVSNLGQFIIIPMILSAIGIVIAYLACHRMNKTDVI